jgi:hypothetical protein
VDEYEASGLGQKEFCLQHRLGLSSLQRQLKKRRITKSKVKGVNRLVAVELRGVQSKEKAPTQSALEVVLQNGRRIEVRADFDSGTLVRVLEVLEGV